MKRFSSDVCRAFLFLLFDIVFLIDRLRCPLLDVLTDELIIDVYQD